MSAAFFCINTKISVYITPPAYRACSEMSVKMTLSWSFSQHCTLVHVVTNHSNAALDKCFIYLCVHLLKWTRCVVNVAAYVYLHRVTKEVDADSQEAKSFLKKEEKEAEQQTSMSKASAASSLTAGPRYKHKHSLRLPFNILKGSSMCPPLGNSS